MKTFAIFPTITVFILVLTLMQLTKQRKLRTDLLISLLFTTVFGIVVTYYSVGLFSFFYNTNFIGVMVTIPCLIYLANNFLPKISGMRFWFRILGLGLAAAALTLTIFGTAMFFAILSNPEPLLK